MKTKTKERIWNYVMLVGLLSVFVAGYISLDEFLGAKEFCNSIEGDYTFKVFPLPVIHSCNNGTLFRYTDGWNFEKYNLTISIPE